MAPKSAQGEIEQSQSRSESQQWEASQEQDSVKLKELMTLRKEKDKQRRRERKEGIENTSRSRNAHVKARMQQCSTDYGREVSQIRRNNLERILELQEKRQETQTKLDKCVADLQRATASLAHQYQVALNGRLQEMEMS